MTFLISIGVRARVSMKSLFGLAVEKVLGRLGWNSKRVI